MDVNCAAEEGVAIHDDLIPRVSLVLTSIRDPIRGGDYAEQIKTSEKYMPRLMIRR